MWPTWRFTTSTRSASPPGADAACRWRANEEWARRALDYRAQGIDLLLAGQTPPGEFLESPSAPLLDAISACLLDCDHETRVTRLRARGPEWFTRSAGELQDYLNWAEWLRRHARERHVRVIDTSALSAEQVADELAAWIAAERDD